MKFANLADSGVGGAYYAQMPFAVSIRVYADRDFELRNTVQVVPRNSSRPSRVVLEAWMDPAESATDAVGTGISKVIDGVCTERLGFGQGRGIGAHP